MEENLLDISHTNRVPNKNLFQYRIIKKGEMTYVNA